jgi:hypothetical protein
MLIEPAGWPLLDHVNECRPGLSMPRRRSQARSMLRARGLKTPINELISEDERPATLLTQGV